MCRTMASEDAGSGPGNWYNGELPRWPVTALVVPLKLKNRKLFPIISKAPSSQNSYKSLERSLYVETVYLPF